MKKLRLKNWIIISFILIGLCGVIYYSYEIIIWKLHVNANEKIHQDINDTITIAETVIDNVEEQIEEPKIEYRIDFELLKKQNPDAIAYINVNNTNIDYLVVKGSDNSYYLNHNFNKKYNVAGWIFADYHNKFDETDKNLIIYGHNTKDGTMFGSLKNILNKEWYMNEENYQIVLTTNMDTYLYEVFSVYTIVAEDYYINTEFNSDDSFYDFVKTLKSRSIYNFPMEVSKNDKILTLSSCISNGNKRVVLHAKLLEKEESLT